MRTRAVSLKGTFVIIPARPVSRTAPGGVHRRGALPLIQPKPRPRVAAFVSPPPRPQPRAAWAGAGCAGWCFPRRPAALGPARGACSCGHPPTPSAPDVWPQPPRRSSSFSHPTCKYYRTPTPVPSLRASVVVCLLCRSSRSAVSGRSASRELAQSFLPAPFLGLPLGMSTDVRPCP